MQNFRRALSILLMTMMVSTTNVMAGDTMLTDQPYFTYRIEAKGLRYQAKINGTIIHEDLEGNQLATEEPINHFMRSGKNRISLNLYPWKVERYDGGTVSVSLYVNRYGDPEKNKILISQISFDSNDLVGDEAKGRSGVRSCFLLHS